MNLQFDCLILDHDDTAVDSSRFVHYPAHISIARRMRPGHREISIDEWFEILTDPGFGRYLRDGLGLNDEELVQQEREWRAFAREIRPSFFEGFPEFLTSFVEAGGVFAVVTHSSEEFVRRDYEQLPSHVRPAVVYGGERPAEQRKPSPWPVLQVLDLLSVSPARTAVVDDARPGIEMAHRAGVYGIGAGWAHGVARVHDYLASAADVLCLDVECLARTVGVVPAEVA